MEFTGTVKPLAWDDKPVQERLSYARTPFGSYQICVGVSGEILLTWCFNGELDEKTFECEDLETAKVMAEADWLYRLSDIIDFQDPH